jgi:Na+/phosphate symporter
MPGHGERYEDYGVGRILKLWPALLCIFAAGAWRESSRAMDLAQRSFARIQEAQQTKLDDHDHRITKVEDAVISLTKTADYLAQIVKEDRQRR